MRPFAVITFTFALSFAVPIGARATRPTPHELIDLALQPVSTQLTQLNATESERHDVADIIARGETIASELVEAQHRSEAERVTSLTRQIALLSRVVRGRIEAGRAEAQATEAERTALEADARRVQARAALERAAEKRLELEREPTAPVEPPATPPASTPASASTPAATPAARPASAVHATPTHRGHR